MTELSDREILDELGVSAEPEKKRKYTAREERIIAGFEDIQRFVEEHGRAPAHGEALDIFERMYAVRLDRIRELEECRTLLADFDHQGLLGDRQSGFSESVQAPMSDQQLLDHLGVGAAGAEDITDLRHVPSRADKRAAEEIANRKKCDDFEKFKPLFDLVRKDLAANVRTTRKFVKDAGFLKADIVQGQFFILGGQTAYVADVGETVRAPNGELDARLRVIYSNGTESNLLRRSLQRALYKDEAGRRITDPEAGPLFADRATDEDTESGTIYVLRSKSEHPDIAANRDVIHKIGVTGGSVEQRIVNAALDPTFLMADVEIVATYDLFNINRSRLENLLHRFFGATRLDVEITDRFGNPIKPREWFLVPLSVVDEVVSRIQDGSISDVSYDPATASLQGTSTASQM